MKQQYGTGEVDAWMMLSPVSGIGHNVSFYCPSSHTITTLEKQRYTVVLCRWHLNTQTDRQTEG